MERLREILQSVDQLDHLPPEIAAEIAARREAREDRIEAIAKVVCAKRKEAIDHRRSSGIEAEWTTAEMQYTGLDEANSGDQRWIKPASPDGVLTTRRITDATDTRSTIFLNITRPYTDAAAARVADLLVPTDDRNWSLAPTPVPELSAKLTDKTPIEGAQTTAAPPQEMGPDGQPVPGIQAPPAGAEPGQPRQATVADVAQALLDKASEKAAAAQRRIDDWLTQCQYHGEQRKAIMDCAKLGTAVLKGPVAILRRGRKIDVQGNEVTIEIVKSLDPATTAISPWNAYPDPACGGNLHNGGFFIERDDISAKKLRELRGMPGYSAERINRVLAEGPVSRSDTESERPEPDGMVVRDDTMFDIWYFYGSIDKADFEVLDADEEDILALFSGAMSGQCGDTIPAIVTMVNDRPIRVALNPLDSGAFPYDTMPWQERAGSVWGFGVPYQIRTPQEMINAAARNMMDNAGLAGGPIIVVDQSLLEPADGNWTITPRKVFTTLEDAIGRDIRGAITSIAIPSMINELMPIIQFGLKMAEDVTGLPQILQGQLGKAPDTLGGLQLLQNNASSVVRRLAKAFDDKITIPHIDRYYEWLMIFGDDPAEKGDFQIEARGSSALIERDMQNQTIASLLPLSVNPIYGLSPARCMEEMLRSQRFDPARFKPTRQELEAMQQQPQQPPPQVMAAQIRAESAKEIATVEAQVDMARAQLDRDRDTAFVQAQTDRTRVEAEAKMQELQLKLQLAQLEYASKHQLTLEQVKKDLAIESAKINLTRELAHVEASAKQLPTPPVEPPGRAPAGQSFAQ